MQDLIGMINALRRPKLLVRAARFGIDDYVREQHLSRILKRESLPRSGAAILKLLEIEADHEDQRKAKMAEYSIAHHVEVLIALMGEARVLRATTRS
ncbi:DUF6477 family protein [Aestuariibius sp. HNIBRBA575]|uniref:DUF6477 family protein n=1 Tax=Aestuariibius sp. HNIBRBA575 TaxID=3233343 RepID=UPI0034A0F11B